MSEIIKKRCFDSTFSDIFCNFLSLLKLANIFYKDMQIHIISIFKNLSLKIEDSVIFE